MKNQTLSFAPGPVPGNFFIPITYSHRTSQFEKLYKSVIDKLQRYLPEHKVLLIQGSSASAIEAVVTSFGMTLTNTQIESHGVFGDRFMDALADNVYNNQKLTFTAGVQFETSKSKYVKVERQQGTVLVLDCVSCFPYKYDKNADIIITSSSKILSGLPVMGIVYIKKHLINQNIIRKFYGYLSISEYLKYDQKNQTPHTSMIPQIMSLNKALNNVIGNVQIRRNIRETLKAKVEFLGDIDVPVLTVRLNDEIVKRLKKHKIELYKNKIYTSGDIYQISMFNYKNENVYKKLVEVINNESSMRN